MILFDIQNADKAKSLLERFQWKTASVRWASEVAPKVLDEIKREAPVRTGALRDSTTVRVESRGDRVKLVFSADEPYAPFVIHGTAPHMIFPKSARALHWTTGGADAFATRVSHPGTRPNNYPERGTRKILGDISLKMVEAIRQSTK